MVGIPAEQRVELSAAPRWPKRKGPAIDRIIGRVILDTNNCWIYTGNTGGRSKRGGYGQLSSDGKVALVHRITYQHFRGEIPEGLEIDHLCRVRACANPWHLEAVPRRINQLRGNGISGVNARKTHCPQGHAYDLDKPYGRICSICRREQRRAYAARNREKERARHRAYGAQHREEERARHRRYREKKRMDAA